MKRRSRRPVFGEKGTKLIEYTGETPVAFGPFVTGKLYRFRPGKNPRLVDVRDLTLLTKAAGRESLRDVNAETPKPKRIREPKPEQLKSEPVKEPAEQKEATNGTE